MSEVSFMAYRDFFSRTAGIIVGALLLVIVLWTLYMVGPVAFERWGR